MSALSQFTMSPKSFAQFSEFITRELGIKMPPEKLPMLQSRLQRRLRQLDMDTLEAYQDYLFQSPESANELIEFINLTTTNKTDFFRESKHFDYLVQTALPSMAHAPGQQWHFKLWCAGCSSGEEPYTLAMVLNEHKRAHPGFDFSIFATDISTRVLDLARNAVYEESKIEPVSMELRRRYLMRSKNRENQMVRITPELREKVRFERLNFMDADYGIRERFDAIFFRNVMIYFDRPTQEAVIKKQCRHLKTDGYLFVGHSESLVGLDLPIRSVGTSIFQKTV